MAPQSFVAEDRGSSSSKPRYLDNFLLRTRLYIPDCHNIISYMSLSYFQFRFGYVNNYIVSMYNI
jgi:hypothetical protein